MRRNERYPRVPSCPRTIRNTRGPQALWMIWIGCLLFLLLSVADKGTLYAQAPCPANWVCPADPVYQSRIGIWYTIWWQQPSEPFGEHWSAWSRYKPVLGYYSSGDPAVIRAHVSMLKNAGIDYLVLDHTNSMDNDNGAIDKNAQAVFNTIRRLPPSEQLPVAVAIGFNLWGQRSVKGQNAEAQRVWASYATQPIYYRWGGKPLLVNYNAYDTAEVAAPRWEDPRFTVRRATGVVDRSNALLWPYADHGYWGWVHKEPTYVHAEVMGVMPGWDTAHLGRPTNPVDREEGMLYQREWLQAIAHNPKTILISGWNDFAEEVSIEPAYAVGGPAWQDFYGAEVPDWYMQITRAYAQLRTGLAEGYCYREEDSLNIFCVIDGGLIHQTEAPHGRPVVALPAGTISALRHHGAGWAVIKGTGPEIFLAMDRARLYVGSMEQLSNLGFSAYETLEDAALESIPLGPSPPSLPGRLVSAAQSGTVYYFDRGIKFPVAPADLSVFGFDPNAVLPVADDVLDAFPTSAQLKWPIQAPGGEIFLAGSGRRQTVGRLETLNALGFTASDVRWVSDKTLASYQPAGALPEVTGPVLERPNGALYLLHLGVKRPTTREDLILFGITDPPQPVSDAVMDAFPSALAMRASGTP